MEAFLGAPVDVAREAAAGAVAAANDPFVGGLRAPLVTLWI